MNTSNVLEPFKDQQKSHVAILGLNTRFGILFKSLTNVKEFLLL